MKKQRTTQKNIKSRFAYLIKADAATMHHLLRYKKAFAYTVRVEGWAADIYDLGAGVALVSGYQPFGSYRVDYNTAKQYNAKALKVLNDQRITKEATKKARLNDIIDKLISDTIKEV